MTGVHPEILAFQMEGSVVRAPVLRDVRSDLQLIFCKGGMTRLGGTHGTRPLNPEGGHLFVPLSRGLREGSGQAHSISYFTTFPNDPAGEKISVHPPGVRARLRASPVRGRHQGGLIGIGAGI